ncbi:MAG: glycine cleavage system protein GcvH [Steroidobacteraceae bacterium]
MSNIPAELKYLTSHEWVRVEADGTLTVGISDHAQAALGDLVFVETPDVGRELKAGEAFAVVESVKAASDVYSPVSGEVLAVNEALGATPELINQSPYADGWLMKVRSSDSAELTKLLDATAYQAVVDAAT